MNRQQKVTDQMVLEYVRRLAQVRQEVKELEMALHDATGSEAVKLVSRIHGKGRVVKKYRALARFAAT